MTSVRLAYRAPLRLAHGLACALVLAAPLPGAAQQANRVVALVVSVGNDAGRANAVQASLQAMGAETLRTIDPQAATLRSVMYRFAEEAEEARASFVYLDLPVVSFEGRAFVLPDQARLDRPTDLFTQAVPLQAFARMAAHAEQGGAVILSAHALPLAQPEGVQPVTAAPEPISGSSAILVIEQDQADAGLEIIDSFKTQERIDMRQMLQRLSDLDGASLSALPARSIFLKNPPEDDVTPTLVATSVPNEAGDQQDTASPQDLARIERSLSRAVRRTVQRTLRDLGHYNGLIDGIMGTQTRDAITSFQTVRSETQSGFLTRQQLLDLIAPG